MLNITTDHAIIRQWAEVHDATPVSFDHPNSKSDKTGIRLNFPGGSDEALFSRGQKMHPISWDEFFEIFEKKQLAFVYDIEGEKDSDLQYRFENRSMVEDVQILS